MKTPNRIILAALAGLLASCGVLVGPQDLAHAKPAPEFPTCNRANIDGNYDQLRVWLNPGTLYDPRKVAVGDAKLDRRRDGIFTGVVTRPEAPLENYVLFTFNHRENGVWVKCKKVTP